MHGCDKNPYHNYIYLILPVALPFLVTVIKKFNNNNNTKPWSIQKFDLVEIFLKQLLI